MLTRTLVNSSLLVLFLSGATGCVSIQADGVWLCAYSVNEKESPSVIRNVLEVKGSKVRSKSLELPVQSTDSATKEMRIRRSSPLSLKKFLGDSLRLSYNHKGNSFTYIYKKIPSDAYKNEIKEKDLINGVFVISTKYHKDTLEFFRDGTYLEYINCFNPRDYWMIQKAFDQKFLIVGQMQMPPLILINNSDERITFHSTFTKDLTVDFKRVTEKLDASDIMGDWIEVKTTFPDPSMPERPYKLQVSITSELFDIDREEEPFKWTLSPSGRFIIFQHEYRPWDMRDTAWKILKLTPNQFIIERNSGMHEKEIVEFKRLE